MASEFCHVCCICGVTYYNRWPAGDTCCDAHRQEKSRGIRTGQGRGMYAVREVYATQWKFLVARGVNQETVNSGLAILANHGASAFEWYVVGVMNLVTSFDDGSWGI